MPRQKPWLSKIPHILKTLEDHPETDLFDRQDVEGLFGIGRSAATELMKVAGVSSKARAADGGAVVSQANLVSYVRHSPEAEIAMQELARRAKLAHKLESANAEQRLRKLKLPVTSADEWCDLSELPNVAIEGGVLRVAFSSPLELMGDLYRLCKAAGNDWERFERICGADAPGGKDEAA